MKLTPNMKRTQIYLTKDIHDNLDKDAIKNKVSLSEMIRRIVREYYKK